MAFCPKCRGEMGTTAVVCPHCGYDFPDDPPSRFPDRRKTGLPSRFPVAVALVRLFRVLAVTVGLLFVLVVALSWQTAGQLGTAGWASLLFQALSGIGAVALLLAVAEGLNIALAIEDNTYRKGVNGKEEK